MTSEANAILQQALRLTAVERAALIDALFRSIDKTGDPAIDARWAAEAEARIDAHDAGQLESAPADVVFDRLEKR